MSKRRLAVLIAGMLVGAPIGIASVTGLPTLIEQPAEAPLQAEVLEPTSAEQTEAAQQPSPVEQATVEQRPVSEVGYVLPARPRTLADATFPPLESDAFPPSTDERPLLPSVAAYLDRKAASTLLADAGAPEPVFPVSNEDRMPPSQIAYFEALEAQRVAAAEARAREEQQAMAAPVTAPISVAGPTPVEGPSEAGIDRVAENVRQ